MDTRIFKYNNGTEDIYVDPSEVDYGLSKVCEKEDTEAINNWLDLPRDEDGNVAESEINERQMSSFLEACHRLDPYIRAAFGIAPFDPKTGLGMTHSEVMEVYVDFMEWRSNVKKNTGPPPTGSPPTDSTTG